jgi:hypothetical protein
MNGVRKGLLLVIAVLVLIVAGLAPEARAAGTRLAARIDEPFEVNGERFAGGLLTLREFRAYSPIATMSEVWVDDTCVGIFISPRREAAASAADEIVFARSRRGHLVLVGVGGSAPPTVVAQNGLSHDAPAGDRTAHHPVLLARSEALCLN